METYMQMLFRQTEPLKLSPKPVVSASSLKLGGPSHSSSRSRASQASAIAQTGEAPTKDMVYSPSRLNWHALPTGRTFWH